MSLAACRNWDKKLIINDELLKKIHVGLISLYLNTPNNDPQMPAPTIKYIPAAINKTLASSGFFLSLLMPKISKTIAGEWKTR